MRPLVRSLILSLIPNSGAISSGGLPRCMITNSSFNRIKHKIITWKKITNIYDIDHTYLISFCMLHTVLYCALRTHVQIKRGGGGDGKMNKVWIFLIYFFSSTCCFFFFRLGDSDLATRAAHPSVHPKMRGYFSLPVKLWKLGQFLFQIIGWNSCLIL